MVYRVSLAKKPNLKGWWLFNNKVRLTTAAVIANCFVFLIGLEEPISKNIYSKRIPKCLYGVSLQRLLEESCLLLDIGNCKTLNVGVRALLHEICLLSNKT